MTEKFYSSEKSIQLLVSLLKQHGVKKIIASPGTTNLSFIGSCMHDPWFEMYSSVDERSAAYIACGLAAESGEPVVISCTGATASRNYLPGLTEAYYSKLPVLAVTSTQMENRIGHLVPQVIDRSVIQNDIALLSEHVGPTLSEDDEWGNTVKINNALLELKHHGGGPVHINLTTLYSKDYSVKELPKARKIERIMAWDEKPDIPKGKIAVFIGRHPVFTPEQTEALDRFCAANDAVVFCDHESNYFGKYRTDPIILFSQQLGSSSLNMPNLMIHIGEVSGGYLPLAPKEVWRVSEDGKVKDTFRTLTHVFEMREEDFFNHYSIGYQKELTSNLDEVKRAISEVREKLPEDLPFSNIWIAKETAHRLPAGCAVHLGILNTLRSWNFFTLPEGVTEFVNSGGFGIDGLFSTLVGASLANPNKLYFGVIGDLAFFYDMNVAGNRHVGRNVRLMVINNGKGSEFRLYIHPGAAFGEEADKYIAAGGHYGNQSPDLVRHYAQDLGYEYLSATNKEEYQQAMERFVNPELTEKPMIFEVFTHEVDESDALKIMKSLKADTKGIFKNTARSVLGEKGIKTIKKILK